MEDRLKYIFGLVNDWLKFAEAKNAALLVAVGAIEKPVLDHFPEKNASPQVWWCCTLGTALLLIAAFICLGSFLPQLTFKWGQSKRLIRATDNLYYFGHVAHFSAFDFLAALYHAEGIQNANRKVEVDLAAQIVTNAELANKKYLHFRVAVWAALVALIFFGCAVKVQLRI